MSSPNFLEILHLPHGNDEIIESITEGKNFRIERIVSSGQSSPEGFWYDQDEFEWVMVLQGKAEVEFESTGLFRLECGDYLNIPAHVKHRVTYTSQDPPCIWLAVFIRNAD